MRQFFVGSLLLLMVAATMGCGGRGIPIVPINGKVTFGGSLPPKAGKVMFSPIENTGGNGIPSRPGSADFDASGSFTVMTYAPGDGLIPGKYRATVMCYRETPTLDNAQKVSYVPNDYSAEVVVPNNVRSFDVNLDVPATRISAAGKK